VEKRENAGKPLSDTGEKGGTKKRVISLLREWGMRKTSGGKGDNTEG